MGDGSAVMQSVMMLRGTGNVHQSAEGLPAVDGSASLLDNALQQLEKRFSSGTMGAGSNGWGQASVQNGVFSQSQQNNSIPTDLMDGQQQHAALQEQSGLQQQQQFQFAQAMQQQYQQQVSHMQAFVGAQMAQLHGSVEQQAAAAVQQQALQLAKAAAAAAAPAAAGVQRQRLSKDGSWFNAAGSSSQLQQQQQQQQQQPHHHQQQLQGAVSALRQSLLLQHQQMQRRQSLEQQQQHSMGQDAQQATKPLVFKVGTPGQPGAHMVFAKAGSSTLASSAPGSSKQPPYIAFQQQQQQQAAIDVSVQASGAALPGVQAHNSSTSAAAAAGSTNSSSCRFSATGPPSSNLTVRMTIQLVATYKKCTPPGPGAGVPQPLPRRVLTKPGAAVKNDGWDNEASDLVLCTQVSVAAAAAASVALRRSVGVL
jgi:hypothetical protein